MTLTVSPGFSDAEKPQIAQLYWEAFGQKLARVMGPTPQALRFIENVLDPSHGLCARDGSGAILGVVGFKTAKGALVGGDWPDIRKIYGLWGGAWRAAALSLLERDTDNTRFLMDGIFVTQAARGQGAGTALLAAIASEARTRGYTLLRLDVIDTNHRARALYERTGFTVAGQQNLGPLRHLFGFASATTMVLDVTKS